MKFISGFSRLSKEEKLAWVSKQYDKPEEAAEEFASFWHQDTEKQKLFDEFSENTISNFYMPFGVVPNFLLNDEVYCVPMVIEESSVVAAASKSAKFWQDKGGFRSKVLSTRKFGQVHFIWEGDYNKLYCIFDEFKEACLKATASLTKNMRERGGGIVDIELLDMRHLDDNYYQIKGVFETCDSMGANFINSCLEMFARTFETWLLEKDIFTQKEKDVTIVMSILSNYTPECLVRTWVECPIEDLGEIDGFAAEIFAYKVKKAVDIATNDPYRATTHNKGIFNGIDAVVLATGNDFRAVEACGHTYASRTGQYRSLTKCSLENGIFKFWIDLPIAIGTVGGLTSLHPLSKKSLQMLGNPNVETLMMVVSAMGLAQNFGALKSLVTTGIQKGHMKMHLLNILRHFEATKNEIEHAVEYFKINVVSFSAVGELVERLRADKYQSK